MNSNLLKLQFVALYVVSIAVIGIIMAASWSSAPSIFKGKNDVKTVVGQDVLYADIIMHKQLNEWHDLLSKNASDSVSTGDGKTELNIAEDALQKSLQQLQVLQEQKNDVAEKATLSSLIATYKNTIALYKRSSLEANGAAPVTSNETVATDNALQQKELRIKQLEAEVIAAQQNRVNANIPLDVKTLLEQKQLLSAQNATLSKTVASQKQTIEKLNRQIEAFRRFNEDQ